MFNQNTTSAHTVQSNGSADTPLVLTWPDKKPRILDLELAERLGYDRPRAIRILIRRLLESGQIRDVKQHDSTRTLELNLVADETGTTVGEIEYWLTEEQALFVCARSHTGRDAEAIGRVIASFVAAREQLTRPDAEDRLRELKVRRLEAEAATASAKATLLQSTLSQLDTLEQRGLIDEDNAAMQRAKTVKEILGIDLIAIASSNQPQLPSGPNRGPVAPIKAIVPRLNGPAQLTLHVTNPEQLPPRPRLDTSGYHSARRVGQEFDLSGAVVGKVARELGLYANEEYGLWREFQPNDGATPLRHWMYSDRARQLLRPKLSALALARSKGEEDPVFTAPPSVRVASK